jgi:hypothetical protein
LHRYADPPELLFHCNFHNSRGRCCTLEWRRECDSVMFPPRGMPLDSFLAFMIHEDNLTSNLELAKLIGDT